ncbi:MAG: WD40/YVTN/BNR-like repeat-containing protein, partial [Schleiferiaceae bacterium]
MNRTRLAALISGSAVLLTGAAVALHMSSAPEARQYTFRDDLAQGRFAGYNEYLHMMRANQVTGEIDPAAVEAAWAQLLQTAQKTNTLNWESRGPDNHGGRTRALLVDRNNSNIVYAGSVGGGLYRSTNGGASWNV